jgi:hypothetical protein
MALRCHKAEGFGLSRPLIFLDFGRRRRSTLFPHPEWRFSMRVAIYAAFRPGTTARTPRTNCGNCGSGALRHRAASSVFRLSIATILGAGVLVWNGNVPLDMRSSPVSSAQAVIGRPLTPLSCAGVARHTTRRAVAAGAVYGAPVVAAPVVVGPRALRSLMFTGVSLRYVGDVDVDQNWRFTNFVEDEAKFGRPAGAFHYLARRFAVCVALSQTRTQKSRPLKNVEPNKGETAHVETWTLRDVMF